MKTGKTGAGKVLASLFLYVGLVLFTGAPLIAQQNSRPLEQNEKNENTRRAKYVFFRIGIAFSDISKASVPPGQLKINIQKNSVGHLKWNPLEHKRELRAFLQQYAYAMKHGDRLLAARSAINAAAILFQAYEMDSSRYYYLAALKLFEELQAPAQMSVCHISVALTYFYQNNYEEAMTYNLKSIAISEQIGHKLLMGNNNELMGDIYYNLGNYKKSLEYHHMSLIIRETIDRPMFLGNSFLNIGMCHAGTKNYQRALLYYNKALSTYRTAKHQLGISETLMEMASLYIARGNLAKALDCTKRSLDIGRQLNNQILIARNMYYRALIHIEKKQYEKARVSLEKSLETLTPLNLKNYMLDCHVKLSIVFQAQKQYKKSMEHYKAYLHIKDSLAPLEIRGRMLDAQLGYQSEKQKQAIAELQKDNEIKNLRLSKNELIRNLIIAGFVLLFGVLLFFSRRYIAMLLFWKRQKYAGSYRLLDKIGSGGMGSVYKARGIARKSGKIAVKVLREELFNDPRGRERFEREAKIVSNLDHPNIVKMIEYGMHRDKLFIAMELLDGKNLATEIKEKGRFAIRRAVKIAVQVADALENIHRRRFVHRDLKPENIMLVPGPGNPDHVKLLDFGLARGDAHHRLTATGILVGTIGYMPPEVVAGSEYSAAGDIYALGVMIYEMVTGERPFYARSTTDMMRQILDTPPTSPLKRRPDVPGQLDKLVMLMLEKEEEKRPTASVALEILNELKFNREIF